MKKKLSWKSVTVTGLILSLSACGRPQIVIPEAQPLPDSLISVSISDVHKTIDAVQHLSDQILPGNAYVDLKTKLGSLLNDPELSSIPGGSGAIWSWDGILWYAALECDPKQHERLSKYASDLKLLSALEENLFLLAQYPQGITAAKAQAEALSLHLKTRETAGLFVDLRLADLVEKFRPQINMAIMMLPNIMAQGMAQSSSTQAANAQSMAKIGEAEIRILTSIGAQIEHLEVSMLPLGEGLEIIHTLSAKADSNFHQLITAPDTVKPDPKISAERLPPGVFELEMFIGNSDEMKSFIDQEFHQLIAEMPLETSHVALWKELMDFWPNLFNGSMAETFTMDPDVGISMGYLVAVKDEEKILSTLSNLPALMKPITEMYQEMGMPMELEVQLNTRSYKNHPVHQYNFHYDLDKMDPLVGEQLQAMNFSEMNSEFTIADGRWLWTMGSVSIESLVDAMDKKPENSPPLTAKKHYPSGGIGYYDIDIDTYFDYITSITVLGEAEGIISDVSAKLKNSPPVIGAFYKQENRLQSRMMLPVNLLASFRPEKQTGML
ncbi:hypothetical protein P0Y35_04675 [Kiritimatiellaeota bacterium B1221]|nr:hypothetical protein [Kiritimatiellaeota bacterium B1221]